MVDCGGGTVDITAFEVNNVEPGKLAQLGDSAGGNWGATNIDRRFQSFLKVRHYEQFPVTPAVEHERRMVVSSDLSMRTVCTFCL